MRDDGGAADRNPIDVARETIVPLVGTGGLDESAEQEKYNSRKTAKKKTRFEKAGFGKSGPLKHRSLADTDQHVNRFILQPSLLNLSIEFVLLYQRLNARQFAKVPW